MRKVRVHELAKELRVPSKAVIVALREEGEFVKSASSTVEHPAARKVRARFATSSGLGLKQGPSDSRSYVTPMASSVNPPRMPQPVAQPRASDETSRSMYGWSANPVREPKAPDVVGNIAMLERAFPEAADIREVLSTLGSQFVYASVNGQMTNDCGAALIRFSGAIEAAFGFTREVLIFFTPFQDLHVRTLQRVRRLISHLQREITPDLVFISGRDLRLHAKLQDWSKPEFGLIPLQAGENLDAVGLIHRIRDHVYSRDLFNRTTPVKGGQFFGRKTLLQALHDDIRSQRVSGIFGLRKAGKTSVLKQLEADFDGTTNLTVLLDLETFTAPPDGDPTPDIIRALIRKIKEELRANDLRVSDLHKLGASPSIPDFKIALEDALSRVDKSGYRVIVMLDEIEFLTPADRIDVAEGPMPQIAQFLAALRSVVQESSNFTFVLSGLTSAIIEGGRLYGRPNPLFSWAKPYYIGPLSRDEADQLATTVGAKMGIEIEPPALTALYDASGGHAFLYRNLASTVVERLPIDTLRRRISNPDVLYALDSWRGSIRGSIEEMVDHVRRYYVEEAILLDALEESEALFRELAYSEPQALSHLVGLGLVRRVGTTYVRNTLLELK